MPDFNSYGYTVFIPFQPITYLHSSNAPYDLRIHIGKQHEGYLGMIGDAALYYRSPYLDAHGKPRIRIWKNSDTLFIDVSEFFFWLKDETLYCFAKDGFEQIRLEQILFGTVIPIWLESRGVVCLHASAACLDGIGIGFLANSGTGKSTLLAQLISQNSRFVTDDILALRYLHNGFYALPGYPEQGLRYDQENLFPVKWQRRHDTISNKLRIAIPLEYCAGEPISLSALFILLPQEDPCKISIDKLSPLASCIELLRYSYAIPMVRTPDPQRVSMLTRVAKQIHVFELRYPYGINHLPEIQSAILEALTKTPQPAINVILE